MNNDTLLYDPGNEEFQLALEYVNQTQCSIFLTGKAGSGKTTFLKYLKTSTLKNAIVVSPTGVAAINAGGVTMHSMFALPFQPYVEQPISEHQNGSVINKQLLLKGLRISTEKRNILEKIQLLIIDEVSMLRCDMLDAIDTILQSIRKNRNPFGGVQVLYIGDMYQLPPVIQEHERQILSHYYQGFYFFNAKVIERQTPIYIELKKIYRQSDETFINVLNNIRTNTMTPQDFSYLNQRYIPNFLPHQDEHYITLTTRNNVADRINTQKLEQLKTAEYSYNASIVGDFSDKSYPCPFILKLKVGAQVMFVRNDTSADKKYFNGKLAVVSHLSEEEIFVRFEDTNEEIKLNIETWENIKYGIKSDGNIEEEILGTFTQYPLRLAWAITVHKSQGLTFEKAVLDIGRSFEFGQVYVALSRCKSYEGLVLLNPIGEDVIFSDLQVQDFSNKEAPKENLRQELPKMKFEYSCDYIFKAFNFDHSLLSISDFELHIGQNAKDIKANGKHIANSIGNKITELQKVANSFLPQLKQLLFEAYQNKNTSLLEERMGAAVTYFCTQWATHILEPLSTHYKLVAKNTRAKAYIKEFKFCYITQHAQLLLLKNISHNGLLFNQKVPNYDHLVFENLQLKNKVADTKNVKISTQEITLKLLREGKTTIDIAKERKLSSNTIEGHLIYWLEKGELLAENFIPLQRLNALSKQITESNMESLSELKSFLGEGVSYFELRITRAWMKTTNL